MRSRERFLHSLLVAVAIASTGACSEEGDAPSTPQTSVEDCKLIANRCHFYDVDGGSQLAHDCHEVGHDRKDIAVCTSMKASCLAECPARDGGDHGGSGGMSNDAAPDSSTGGTSAGTGGTAGDEAGSDSSTDAGGTSGSGGTAGSAGSAGSAGTGGAAGTSGTGGHGGSGGATGTACEQLGSICHGIPGAFTEHCHNLGHDEVEPACEAELQACLAACRG
jgi:hypothetical protein